MAAVALVLAVSQLLLSARLANAEARLANSMIGQEPWKVSEARLLPLASRMGGRAVTAEGRAVLAALTDNPAPAPSPPLSEALLELPLRSIFDRAIEERRYLGVLNLSDRVAATGTQAFADYRAAALLELGRSDEARAVDLGASGDSRLRRRLGELLSAGDLERLPVRDRRGEILGWMAADGEDFVLRQDLSSRLVPQSAIESLRQVRTVGGARLTLDLGLTRIADRALGGYRGSIVIVDPATGDILAAVSDSATLRSETDPAFKQMREPASIAKLITVSAARRAGIDVDQALDDLRCRGSVKYEDDVPLYCASISGKLGGLDRALAVSCNVAFAELGAMVGRQAMLEEYERYGFGRDTSGVFGRVTTPQGTDRQLGELSIGLEVSEISPVHAALQAAVLADGGRMHEPRLLLAQDSLLGFSSLKAPMSESWQVLDPSWVAELTHAMEAVVAPGGTAARVSPSNFPVALKTGTASHPDYGFHVNYIGFGPLPEARYAFSVRITHQSTSARVRRAAYSATHRLLNGLAGKNSDLSQTLTAGQ